MASPSLPAGALLAAVLCSVGGPARSSPAEDTDPPKIMHLAVTQATRGAPVTVNAAIVDVSEIFEPLLYYRPVGAKRFTAVNMNKSGPEQFVAEVPEAALETDFEYFLEAYDTSGNGPARFASSAKPQLVRVHDPPPLRPLLADPNQGKSNSQAVAPQAEVRWTALRIAGLATSGAGLTGLGVGAFFHLSARQLNSQANADPNASSARLKQAKAESKTKLASACAIAGGAAVAAGLTMILVAPDLSSSTRTGSGPRAQIFLAPSGVAFALDF